MPPPSKPEFPPLLSPGLYVASLKELRQLCVTGFSLSTTRGQIMDGLEVVFRSLCQVGLDGELWINGSFLTHKMDPEDVDISLCIPNRFYDNGTTAQITMLDWFNDSPDVKAIHHCDAYVWFDYPREHSLYQRGVDKRDYWKRTFGFSRGHEAKGIIVVLLPDGAR